ncbi:hypothetical protein EVAR_36932_1 [Eumeta japonica]|uniref:Histone-lysine N-methyltransferase SETMAR n=1 Tax=Eumeta variegata TaxID=151549 RepID=A0A4C1X5M0_EUMVA|nr:hypothetical protein EVAR_36932_1 [Eumeta japonica]
MFLYPTEPLYPDKRFHLRCHSRGEKHKFETLGHELYLLTMIIILRIDLVLAHHITLQSSGLLSTTKLFNGEQHRLETLHTDCSNDESCPHIPEHDTALSHVDRKKSVFGRSKTELTGNPPYSPELAPNDFYLFPNVQDKLRSQRFSSRKEAVDAFKMHVLEIPQSEWTNCCKNWFQLSLLSVQLAVTLVRAAVRMERARGCGDVQWCRGACVGLSERQR